MRIPAPCGELEADLRTAEQAAPVSSTIAVLSHPHPLYGGSMHDGVLASCAEVLLDHGVDCLRFNFRGVGASDGRHDQGVGEVDDVVAAANWAGQQDGYAAVWLLGYSFGAAMTWQALGQLAPQLTVLVAPPLGSMAFPDHPSLPGQVTAIAGDADDFVNSDRFRAWEGVATHLLPGADHFFSTSHQQLQNALADTISQLR